MMTQFIQWSGVINILSGIFLLGYWYLYAILMPYKELSSTLSILVKNRNWTFVNILGVSGAIMGLVGQSGLYFSQIEEVGQWGLIGFVLASIGTCLLLGPMLWDTIIWPILVAHDSKLLDFQGPIYSSKTFLPFFIMSGMLQAAGYVIVGVTTAKAGVHPAAAAWLLGIGSPLFGLGAMFGKAQVIPRTIGVTMMSVGLIWLGSGMWTLGG